MRHLLLVDDDPTINFFNRYLIGKMNIFDQIHVAENGQLALDKIEELQKIGETLDMILLDINMPIMNGFEFLDHYEKLSDKIKSSVVVCMLTTSLAKEDLEMSKEYDLLSDYIDKPLYEAKMRELINKYFGK
ncbi:MAG: response regulator [Crocinitomicaceae bacterium]|nr:response regulator [Crocinitomicaceae bacterium]